MPDHSRHLQTAEGELRIEIPQAREAAIPFVSKLFPKWHCKRLLRTDPLKALVIGALLPWAARGPLLPGTLFEELGWNYIGPIDGHDIPLLTRTFEFLKRHCMVTPKVTLPAPLILPFSRLIINSVSGTSSRSNTACEKYDTTASAMTTHTMITPASRQ